MSHFAVLVIFKEGLSIVPEKIMAEVEREMAPFMENCCGEPDKIYMQFYDEEDEYLKQYEEGGREMVVMPDGRLLLPWDEEFRRKPKKGEDPLKTFVQPEAPKELKRRQVPFKETFSTFEEFVKEWHGRSERDETYNRYGYFQNGPKHLVEVCLGNEEQILQGLPEMEARKILLSGEKKGSGRWNYNIPILPMQTMLPSGEQKTDSRTTSEMALEREVWDFLERISTSPQDTKRIMSDLFSTVGRTENSSGPRSQIRTGESYIVRALQYTLRNGSRQYRGVTCGNKVPHKAHIISSECVGEAKWDWYEIGGRWAGFFQLKKGRKGAKGKQYNFTGELSASSGGLADICLKGAVDFEAMRKINEDAAAKRYDLVQEAIKDTPPAESWEIIRAEFDLEKSPQDIKVARKVYADQPRVKAFQALGYDVVGWMSGVEEYQIPRDQYLLNARNSAAVPFAVLKDGKWYESGKMGWWGITSDDKDPETWNSMVNTLYDELPEQALLVICDCHI